MVATSSPAVVPSTIDDAVTVPCTPKVVVEHDVAGSNRIDVTDAVVIEVPVTVTDPFNVLAGSKNAGENPVKGADCTWNRRDEPALVKPLSMFCGKCALYCFFSLLF